jgi:hypothetical protein
MEENTKVNGLIIIWRVWEFTPGKMEEDMKESIKMIRSMVMVYIHGQI